jgi:hypothetical protein
MELATIDLLSVIQHVRRPQIGKSAGTRDCNSYRTIQLLASTMTLPKQVRATHVPERMVYTGAHGAGHPQPESLNHENSQ